MRGRATGARALPLLSFLALLTLLAPAPARGQVLEGQILDESDDEPVESAYIRLTLPDGTPTAVAFTDADGRYTLRVPSPGEYRIQVESLGYAPFESALLAIEDPERTYPVDLLLTPRAIPVEGITVTAERLAEVKATIQRTVGVDPESLRLPLITPAEIRRHAERGHGLAEVIQWAQAPMIEISGQGDEVCFLHRLGRCLPVYLDGARIHTETVGAISLEMIEAAQILDNNETVLYPDGAILLFSRGWVR